LRIDFASSSILSYLDPEMREDILNNEKYEGDRWKADAYSLGLILLQCMLLKDLEWLQDLTFTL
jgi:hypothetical protein